MTESAQTPKPEGPSKSDAATPPAGKQHWLVRKGTIRLLWIFGLAILAALVVGDFFLVPYEHFGIDGTFGFYAWYGLVTCIAMVIVAKFLGRFLSRKDTYYDDQ